MSRDAAGAYIPRFNRRVIELNFVFGPTVQTGASIHVRLCAATCTSKHIRSWHPYMHVAEEE